MPLDGQEYARGTTGPANQGAVFATVSAAACLSVQRPALPCRKCADECPTNAVRLSPRQIELLEEKCVGCGRCAAACPTDAISIAGFVFSPHNSPARFQCARVPHSERQPGDTVVPCLGGLKAFELLRQTDGAILVDRGWCQRCPSGGREAPWDKTLARVNDALSTLDAKERISVSLEPLSAQLALPAFAAEPPAAPALTRRQLFSRLSQPKAKAPRANAVASASNSPPGHVTIEALIARRDEFSRLSKDGMLPGALFPTLQIATTCCDSQVCTRSCPTDALRSVQKESARELEFDAALCVDCGECERSCPTGSISVSPIGDGMYAGPISLRTNKQSICTTCSAAFVPETDDARCPACRKDNEMAMLGHGLQRKRQMLNGTEDKRV